jgi:hypothetical protein
MLRAISIQTSLFVPCRGRHGVGHGDAFTKLTSAAFLTSLHAFLRGIGSGQLEERFYSILKVLCYISAKLNYITIP